MTESDDELLQEEPAGGRPDAVPYVAFSRFKSLVERVRKEGLPQVFDQSFFGSQSGSLTAQQRGALKFLDLIDDDRKPTELFRELVRVSDEHEKALLRSITVQKYAAQFGLGTDATRGQLAETFRQRGLTGETVNKAISFFLTLADEVGEPVSPHFKKGAATTAGSNGSGRRSQKRKKVTDGSPSSPTQHSENPPPAVPTTPEGQRAMYVSMLMEMAKKSGDTGQVQTDLLDRIERALGLGDSASSASTNPQASGS